MANILNWCAIFLQIWKQKSLEAEALSRKIEKVKGSYIVKSVQKIF